MVVFSLYKVVIDERNGQKCAVDMRNQLVFIPVVVLWTHPTLRESREPFFVRKGHSQDRVTRQAGGGAPDGVGGRLRSWPGSPPASSRP